MPWWDKSDDDVQDLADSMGRDLYVGSDGFVRTDAQDTVSSNMASEGDYSRGASGGCTQDSDNVPDSNDK